MATQNRLPYYDALSFNLAVRSSLVCETDSISLFHVNIGSMKNKEFEIQAALRSLNHRFDILAFSETWFTSETDVPFFGYKSEGVYRKCRKGGGVALYFKENLQYEVLSDLSLVCTHYESIAVKCSGTLVACAYRPPSSETVEFVQFMRDLLECACTLNMPVILVGDFNINLLENRVPRRLFLEVIDTFDCSNVIQSPMRITMESDTLPDLCVTNHELSSILAGVLTFDLSDHLPIFCFFARLMSKRKKPPTQTNIIP